MISVPSLLSVKAALRMICTRSSWYMTTERNDWHAPALVIEVCDIPITLTTVRWVNVIWSVLEQTRQPGRSSLHVARPTSIFSSTSEGSASTHHDIQHQNQDNLLPPSAPFASPHSADDAVIPTFGGLHAPIGSRGSRHLAAGPERTRSLRRTASEADLSDSAGPAESFGDLDRHSSDGTPLLPEATSSRPVSRDFAFGQQRSPPKVDTEVNQNVAPPTIASSYHTPAPRSARPESMASDNTFGQSVPAPSVTGTMYTARQSERTVRPDGRPITAHSSATMYTADGQLYAATHSMYSAQSAAFATAQPMETPSMHTAQSSAFSTARPTVSMYTASQGPSESAASTIQGPTDYLSAGDSTYTTAQLGSPFVLEDRSDTSTVRGSGSKSGSYYSAPPPVPSHDSNYDTASTGGSLVRHQLYDRPMSAVSTRSSSKKSGRSIYGTALPPPLSRSAHSYYAESVYSDVQSGAKTTISEPDTNVDMIADLERQSSAGSEYYRRSIQRRPATRSRYESMYTAESRPYALANPVSAMPSAYNTARTSMYTTAQGTAMTSELYRSAGGSAVHVSPVPTLPSEPSHSIISSSSTSTVSSRSRRVPVPSLPPPTPSEPSDPYAEGTVVSFPPTVESRVGLEYDLNRMLVSAFNLLGESC